ncbi:MAG: hydrolase, partial [Bacteroidota bacterium]
TTDDEANEIGSNNNAVLALQHKLFSRSNISFLFINRQNTSNKDYILPEDEYNRVIGLDYNLANADNSWNGKFFVHKSFSPFVDGDDYAGGVRLQYNSNHWRIRGSGVFVGRDFNSDLGFIRRKDIFKIDPSADYLLFPKNGFVNRHTFSVIPIVTWRPLMDFQLADYNIIARWDSELRNTGRLGARIFNRYTYLFDEFDPSLSDGIPLPADSEYYYSSIRLEYRSDSRKSISYNLQPAFGQFFNGEIFTFEGDVNYRLQPHFNLSVRARYDKIDLPEPFSDNDIWLIGPRIDITFNKSLFWNTFIQFNSRNDNIGINSRLQWRFAPLSDLFLVYNDNYFTGDVFAPRFRTINLKLTYWLYL